MDITFTGKHKALSSFEWKNIQPLAVISGLNGSGKSQLLSIIRDAYSIVSSNPKVQTLENKDYSCEISGIDLDRNGLTFWHTSGANLNLGGKSFGFDDLEFLVKYIHLEIHSDRASKEEYLSITENHHGTGRALFKGAIRDRAEEIIIEIESRTGKPRLELGSDEISYHFPEEILLKGFDLFHQDSLEMVFYFYIYKKTAIDKYDLTIPISDDAPWEIINRVIRQAGLPYQINEPDDGLATPVFTNALNKISSKNIDLKLIEPETDTNIGFGNISSGERVILSLALLLYYFQNRNVQKKLLILDEPDARLHPSLTKQFFDVIDNVLIRQYGVRVIMTTHSPSTISLAPDSDHCKVYKLSKGPTKIEEVQDRHELISELSDGLLVVSPKTKYVVVEGKNDKPFYESIYKTAIKKKYIKNYPPLVFIPGTNKDSVKHWVKELREIGNTDYYGIIDLDKGNEPSDGVHVLSRYSIENYLLDPINVFVTSTKKIPALSKYEISRGDEETVQDFGQDELQSISDGVLLEIRPSIEELSIELEKRSEIEYTDGRKIQVPEWFLVNRGKDLLKTFQDHFGGPGAINQTSLGVNIRRTKLIPKDLVDLLSSI